MKVVDLHPEDLIDKLSDRERELTAAERERLVAHLTQCSACRFEISVRADLEQDKPLFEQRPQLTFAAHAARRVQSADELPAVAEQRASRARASGSLRPRSRRWPLVLLAASFILCAGGATAAVVTGAVAAPNWLPWLTTPRVTDATHAADVKLLHQAKRAVKSNASAAAPSTTQSAVVPEPSAELSPAPAAPKNVSAAAGVVRQHVPVHVPVEAVPSVPTAPAVAVFHVAGASAPQAAHADSPALHLDPAASLFTDANRARLDGNVDHAISLYHSLQTRFPSSSESELSRALLAQLLLDRGNPDQALAGFDRYLSEGAPVLSVEALVGRARALEQLGKPAQAAAAW